MRLQKKDIIATGLVAAAAVLYLMWLVDATLPRLGGTRATGVVILALGFAASATAVVPGFDQLMHGNRAYVGGTSLLGLVAFISGVVMLTAASEVALAVMMGAMVVLWGISTEHHTMLVKSGPSASPGGPVPVGR